MQERLLSAQELAEQFGVSVYTIHRLAQKEDGLKGYKVGRLTRFKPSEVAAYIETQAIQPPKKKTAMPGMARFRYRPGMKVVSVG